ncbi:unnamed protein product [Brassicogethes aeneus]|uniref:Epg5-like TPR domain-containing protein n=1 Tax=Brassicogethes aeneus TaxID=1431903 RepID=A0A9P0BBU3_BRAAE|nr:unnamed protein product [Brassicogethes aeneus]
MEAVKEKQKPKKKKSKVPDNTEAQTSAKNDFPHPETIVDNAKEEISDKPEVTDSKKEDYNVAKTAVEELKIACAAAENVYSSAEEVFDKNDDQECVPSIVQLEKEQNDNVVATEANELTFSETNETRNFDSLININRQIMSTITCDAAHVAPKMELPKIKPYTEPQLAALYTNTELLTLEEFTNQYVEAELKGLAVKHHHLYDLLMNYLHVREKITGNNLELQQFRKEYKDLQSELWSVYSAEVTGRAECQDGAIVTASHSYNKSIFHRNVFQTVVRLLGNIQRLTYENHVLYSYSAEDLKLQIELFLQSVITNCMNVTQLNRDAKVALTMQAEPMHLKPYLGELRLCISVLFSFQRKLIRDKKFLKETREWLGRLVGILLRVANYQDHLFILNHILRCPSGVGNWASNFVQLPLQEIPVGESPFSNYQINHLVTILASILMPIKEREKFLEDIAQGSDTATEALWVMVDSEGEEDEETSGTSLRENDLVALLNQLPLDNMFRSLLLIQKRNLKDCYDASLLSEHHILRFFSFSTTLLKIFHRGLDTYRQARYNQFSKRLSRFIRHVTQYATDQWEQFLATQDGSDAAMVAKLQVEYDAFFLRAIFYLYSSQKLGAWQFLAVVPYHLVTVGTLWKIFYFLHSSDSVAKDILSPLDDKDYSKMLWEQTLRSQFEEKVNNLEDAETYYLLNTFANMALARSDDDMEFIHTAAMDLLQIGFINESTQDTCSKSSKILLTHITSKHPHLLSNILKKVKENMETIKELALYLYEELPLTIWKIEEVDLKTLSKLLLNNPITSNESKLTRMILSRLNWDNIPYETHCDVAVLAVQAADLEPGYLQWAWQTVLRLKLHINDKKFQEFGRVEDLEKFDVLSKGVREQKPLASFVAVLMTSWGHAVPLICSKGLPQLTFLQHHQKHEAVLFALYEIMPLFIDSQECIINCEKYQEVLQNLLNADRGYISMAKSLIGVQSTVLQQFGNMIETQIVNYTYYDLESPRVLVRLWMNSLVSIPNWNRDFGVIYLLDVIVKTAFFHRDALDVAYNILRELIQCSTPQEQSGTISSLFKWVSSANTNGSLLLSSLTSYTYIAYIMIELEHVEREQKTGLWKELLVQLSKQKGKINVDQAIKKAASVQKTASVASASLCIYRFAQQAMDTPLDHPMLPLLWQKFFCLFLARLPGSSFVDKGCVGEKFFDGLVNFQYFKRIKKRLQETVDYYEGLLDVKDEDNDELEKKEFYRTLLKIFKAFSLWLEEPRLQESNILLSNLPPQYESALLNEIMQG